MKKTRYTGTVMWAAYLEWQQSGLSKKDYCHKNKLPRSAFFYWIKKLGCTESLPAGNFQEVKIPRPELKAHHPVPEVEIEYPSGTKLRIYKLADTAWIKPLL
ncbi:MAG: hypothetical protein M3512_17325 [Bacteroidota bacterium]|jgi:hypothetical protein|nr:hypothetical protein [Bacteroidota bacterium]